MSGARDLPARVLAFYGDDFTGSTDALDVVARAGLAAVLFLRTPDAGLLERFADARVVGIAGTARSQSPAWMRAELPAVFRALHETGAPFVHYKVCSTFDSAPHVGNIGVATRVGLERFPTRPVPIVVGAPALKRFVAFGNLFAGIGAERYRIDRHPVMSRHPVTPMREADLRLHLAEQDTLSIGSMDLASLEAEDRREIWHALRGADHDAVLFDTVDQASLERVGYLLHEMMGGETVFAVGSSGFEYALVAAWKSLGLLPPPPAPEPIRPVERLFAVSGSCSPVTAAQIAQATERDGFAKLRVDPMTLIGSHAAMAHAVTRAVGLLSKGQSVLLLTAEGPDDMATLPEGTEAGAFNERLGTVLGHVLREVLAQSGVRRAVVAGGDTSSHATQQLALHALTVAAPLAPGCPLCVGYSDDPALAGLEIALKGGQMGQTDLFHRAKTGAASQQL